MKKLVLAVATLALTFGLASCNKETNAVGNGVEKKVTMRIGGMQTRAAASGEAIGAKPAILNDGYIVFVSGSDQVVKVVKFGASETITPAILAAGVTIAEVPGDATNVYVLGNVPAAVTIPIAKPFGTFSAMQAKTFTVTSQADVAVGVDRVTLYGGDAITGTAPNFSATFDIKPLAARIEIKDVVAAGDLTSFQVDGIFINNYYEDMRLDGKIGNALKNNGQGDGTKYIGGVAPYVAGFPLYNFDAAGLTPTATKVWAYNVLAPSDNATEHTHVILRLSNIVGLVGTYSGTQFVTIKAFNDTVLNTVLTNLTAGKVYELGSIAINESHLKDEAEISDVTVIVDANVVNWIPTPVTPEI